MNIRQKRRIKQRLQTLLFCAALVWMAASFLTAVPAMAMHPQTTPSILSSYARVETYQSYAYALEGNKASEAVSKKENGEWKLLCTAASPMRGVDLVQDCNVPIGIARHLRVLSHKGMAHDMVLAN